MKKIFLGIAGICILLFACNGISTLKPTPTLTATLPAPTETVTPLPTLAAPATFTASPIPTPTWIHQGPNQVTVPILLYHWIDISSSNSRYYVSPGNFEEQIKLLHNWGYETITLDMLVRSIYEGADLPPRPMIISFDDGHLNNYTTAFPIMQKYGYAGVLYIIGTYMGTPDYMNADQIKEMIAAGWEVGSHSMRHRDLTTLDPSEQRYELVRSRELLEKQLGVPIRSFAYPFGIYNLDIVDRTYASGYTTAMALGYSNFQGTGNILALQRRDIQGSYDLKKFAFFLPWQGDPIFLPTDTPTPTLTPSRTPRVTATP